MLLDNFSIQSYQPFHREQLLMVWERSVRATHQFLDEDDFEKIKLLVQGIDFTQLEVFCLMGRTKVYGFLGVAERKLEMLFLDPDLFGNGYGKQMLDFAIYRLRCETVDVNEQNESARRFYEKAGFVVIGRSETDGEGMPYPILNMQFKEL